MKRGDIALVAVPGNYGKPHPSIIVQSDQLVDVDSVVVALISTHKVEAPLGRMSIAAGAETGLERDSDIMVEKLIAVPRRKVRAVIGRLSDAEMLTLGRMLAFALGLGDAASGRAAG
jgi:mRNA interferase MazF